MDINVTIKCPDLPLAAAAIAKALMGGKDAEETPIPAMPQAAAVNAPSPAPSPAPAPVAGVPVTASPSEVNPTPGAPQTYIPADAMTAPVPVPTAPSPTAVPTTTAPQITGDMVAKAGADLIAANPAAMAQLNGLLQKYGVGCAQELWPDQIGPFATEMRALGAKI